MERSEAIAKIIAECRQRLACGKGFRDSSVLEESPHLMPELADELRKLRLIEDAKNQGEQGSGGRSTPVLEVAPLPPLRSGHKEVAAETVSHQPASPDVPAQDSRLSAVGTSAVYFGDYELLNEIARGGMGVVYRARQLSLNRIVALKMILSGNLASEQDVQRFYAEAEAVAKLDHPNIVPIYEVGEHNGLHYFSMGYIEGEGLDDKIRENPLSSKKAAEYMQAVAGAIDYAHRQGVLHRDIKPSNVLIAENDQPKVTDFGLAKRTESDSNLTATGQILGTASYMPPEQAFGDRERVTAASDVYSLGATLYALVTGRPPFQAESTAATLLQVIQDEPASPCLLNAAVDRDMETVILRCLQKEPKRRYASAQELAEEFSRYLRGEPIHARPISRPARLWRWCQRNRTLAALIVAVVVLLVVGSIVSTSLAIVASTHARRAQRNAENERAARLAETRQREAALTAQQTAESRLADNSISQGISLCESGRVGEGLLWLAAALELVGDDDPRGHLIRANLGLWRQEIHAVRHCWPDMRYVATTFDGSRVLVAGDKAAQLWVLKDLSPWGQQLVYPGTIRVVAISPNGQTVALGGDAGTLVWHFEKDVAGDSIMYGNDDVVGLLFGPEGRRLVVQGGEGREIAMWNTQTDGKTWGPIVQRVRADPDRFSQDGEYFTTQQFHWGTSLWLSASGKQIATTDIALRFSQASDFVRNGSQLLLASHRDGTILWDIEKQSAIRKFPHGDPVGAVTVSRDGKHALTGSNNGPGTLRHWDTATWRTMGDPHTHADPISEIQLNADGTIYLAEGLNRYWIGDVSSGSAVGELLPRRVGVSSVELTPSNQILVATSTNGVWLLDVVRPGTSLLSGGHTSVVDAVRFSPDGKSIFSGSRSGEGCEWDRASRSLKSRPAFLQGRISDIDVHAGADLLVTSVENRVERWRLSTGERLQPPIDIPKRASAVAISPDGDSLATSTFEEVRIWDASTGRPMSPRFSVDAMADAVAFSPRGDAVAAGAGAKLHLWTELDQESPTRQEAVADSSILDCAFSPDARLIATASSNGACQVWDVDTLSQVGPILYHLRMATCVAFRSDGQLLATGSVDGTVRLWDTTTLRPVGPKLIHADGVWSLDFAPSGSQIAVGRSKGLLSLWDLKSYSHHGEEASLRLELATGKALNEHGVGIPLRAGSWHQRKARLDDEEPY